MIQARLKKTGDKQVDQQALFVAGDIIYPGERYIAYSDSVLTILQNHPRVEIKGDTENKAKIGDDAKVQKSVEPPTQTPEEFAMLHFKTVEKYLPVIEDLEFLETAQKLAKSAVLDRINARIKELNK